MVVEAVLKTAGVDYVSVVLGRVVLTHELTTMQKIKVEEGLAHYELELIEDKTKILVERIKTEITSMLHTENKTHLKLSAHLSDIMSYNYTYLANTFSDQEGMTLERYYISQRIERAKELIVYEDLSLNQITDELAYSSVSHFCLQFKKVMGITPAEFRKRCQCEDYIWRNL
jgi:YesN/AraC family two-component response regulator